MHIKNYATALSAAAGLAALLLTACGSGASSHPSAGTTTSTAQDRAVSTVSVTAREDSNWAGYVASSATTKTSFSSVSGSWTQPAADCAAGSPSHSDLTRHATFSKQLTMSDPTVSSAEWIAEAPSRCESASSQDCHILSLADFGSVTFTGASASAGGRTGSITSGLGQVSALTLEANPGFGRLYATAAQADALSGNGSSFTVSWQRPEIQMPAPPVFVTGPLYH
jgi:Peptidase A4 family